MAWRLAQSLVALRNQVNAMSPNRSKVSDGTIGNAEHSARASDHNPNDAGIVCAMDLTHDPAHGIDSEKLANALLASKDRRVKYVISNRKIASGAGGPSPWVWRPYSGKNPHNHHVHISVTEAGADDTTAWKFDMSVAPQHAAAPSTPPANPALSVGSTGPAVERLQKLLKIKVDGQFGSNTKTAVIGFQNDRDIVADGVCGPQCWEELLK